MARRPPEDHGVSQPRWPARVALIVFVGIVVVGLFFVLMAASHPGGERRESMMQKLEKVPLAAPSSAASVVTHAIPSSWASGCSNPQVSGGWSEERVDTNFTWLTSEPVLLAEVGQTLGSQGWIRHDISNGVGQGLVPHWTLGDGMGDHADAFLFATPHGSTQWLLAATYQPLPVGANCP